MKKKLKVVILTASFLLALAVLLACLLYFGVIHINNPEIKGLTVRGVDVSSYQGNIDWPVLASQEVDFAYIKATEGSSSQDPYFSHNWQGASKTNIKVGAYHFFSFESAGSTQAKILTDEYGVKPIIYVSESSYRTIVQGYFEDCGLWYRSVYSGIPADVDWVFWQYSNRHRLNGYDGKEVYIDMNVFSGNENELAEYTI